MRKPWEIKYTRITEGKSKRWAWLEQYMIPQRDGVSPYLERLRIVQCPWFGVFLHWQHAPDSDYDLHDHPWPFVSVILRGAYTELAREARHYGANERFMWSRHWHRWSVHRMRLTEAHKIIDLEPGTMTLVFVGRRQRQWGFYTHQGWIPTDLYDKETT